MVRHHQQTPLQVHTPHTTTDPSLPSTDHQDSFDTRTSPTRRRIGRRRKAYLRHITNKFKTQSTKGSITTAASSTSTTTDKNNSAGSNYEKNNNDDDNNNETIGAPLVQHSTECSSLLRKCRPARTRADASNAVLAWEAGAAPSSPGSTPLTRPAYRAAGLTTTATVLPRWTQRARTQPRHRAVLTGAARATSS